MGDVIADAMLEATTPTDFGEGVAAFMNSGGVAAGLLFDQISGGEQPGEVTYGEAFTVQPFGNTLVVKTCTGQQIYDVLNQQFNNPARRLEPDHAAVGERPLPVDDDAGPHVVAGSLARRGRAPSQGDDYNVTVNNFMADGGDGYTVFRNCTDPLGGDVDVDAFARYLGAHSPVAPPALNRIEKVG